MSDNIGYNTRSRIGDNIDDQQFVDQPSLQDNTGDYQDVSGFNNSTQQQGQTYGATQGTDTDFYGGNDNFQGRTDASYNNDNLDSNIGSYDNADTTQTSYGGNTDLGGNAGYGTTNSGGVDNTTGLQDSSYGTTDNSGSYGADNTYGSGNAYGTDNTSAGDNYGTSDQSQFGTANQPMGTGGNIDQPYQQQSMGDNTQDDSHHQKGLGGMFEKLADKISPGHGRH